MVYYIEVLGSFFFELEPTGPIIVIYYELGENAGQFFLLVYMLVVILVFLSTIHAYSISHNDFR